MWALSVILFILLTGDFPYQKGNFRQNLEAAHHPLEMHHGAFEHVSHDA